ncbi:hypothetical protein [Nostoc sp.]|uniref:hypothetical protein n=1 Tax=Nostoc sp. TaxID=1180 RepID=UPI002FF44E53
MGRSHPFLEENGRAIASHVCGVVLGQRGAMPNGGLFGVAHPNFSSKNSAS